MTFRHPAGSGALALLSALLLVVAFPPSGLQAAAWVALVPLLVALAGRRPLAALGLAALTGVGYIRGVFYWISGVQGVTLTDVSLLNLYLGSYVAVFGMALAFISGRTRLPMLVTAPVLWVAVEYLRANASFLALPWNLLAHSQYQNLAVIQVAGVAGAYSVSFLIVLVNAAIADAILAWRGARPIPWRRLAAEGGVAALALGGTLGYGLMTLGRPPTTEMTRVTVVQGNVAQDERWRPELVRRNLERHIALSRQAATAGTALVIWPETSVQGRLRDDPRLVATLTGLAREVHAHLLVGSAERPKFGSREVRRTKLANSAFLLSPRGTIAGQYDKVRLLPFGEYLPYPDAPWPTRLVASTGQFVPGERQSMFRADGVPFGVVICWEIIFPELPRALVARGARFIVNMTNEAWYGDTAAPHQFLAITVFRAVENGVAVVRSTNTGVSAFIDPRGRIVGRVREGGRDTFVSGALTQGIQTTPARTLYTAYGDVLAFTALVLSGGFVLAAKAGTPRVA